MIINDTKLWFLEIEVFGILIVLWKRYSWTESSLFYLWVEKVRQIPHFCDVVP